jgi:glycosyltransferase involved in cell wall biosynthesis
VTNDDSQFFRHQLEALEAHGVTSEVVAVPGDNESASVKAHGTSTRSLHHYLRFLPPVVRQSLGDFDLLHANNGLTTPAALLQPSLPVVVSLWGTDLMGEYGWVTKRCVRHVEEVIVMSEEMAAELGREAHVIPHGVDLDLFAPQPTAAARAEVGWDSDAAHVLFPYPPGREVKNYPRAARVFERASEHIQGRVELQTVHGVDHDEMPTYMNAADALLFTSKREGSPNTVKEALACDLPVVATDVGDVRQQLADLPLSAVCRTDDDLIEGLIRALEGEGEAGRHRERAHDYGLEEMGRRIRAVYDEVREGDP